MERTVRDPLIGSTIDDRFRLVKGIGQGATSSVYKAEEVVAGDVVAVKILHAHLCTNQSLVARFEREAEAAKILVHPNIVAVKEYAVAPNGAPYLVMEFVDGISLQQKITEAGWVPASQALPLFIQAYAALNVAHQAGIIHRDLKPGNIMLASHFGHGTLVRILDFGCAMVVPLLGDTVLKVTQTGEMLGSLLYMSPEQCLDQDVDGRSDIYSLACVLYETLTGKPPLSARTAFETMNKQISVMPDSFSVVRPDLALPKALEKVIFKAMDKSPSKRYQDVVQFMNDLSAVAEGKDPLPEIHKQEIVVAQKPVAPVLRDLWKTWWPWLFLVFTYLSVNYFPLSLPFIIITFAVMVYQTSLEERRQSNKLTADEAKPTPLIQEPEPQNLGEELARLAPMGKLNVTVHSVQKNHTYASGSSVITVAVSTKRSPKQEIKVLPVFIRSFFWDNICEETRAKTEFGGSLELPAYITKSIDNRWNVIVIKANQATIVDTNSVESADQGMPEEFNFGA